MTVTVQNVQYMHLVMYTANVIMDWYCSSCCYAVHIVVFGLFPKEGVRLPVANGCTPCRAQLHRDNSLGARTLKTVYIAVSLDVCTYVTGCLSMF